MKLNAIKWEPTLNGKVKFTGETSIGKVSAIVSKKRAIELQQQLTGMQQAFENSWNEKIDAVMVHALYGVDDRDSFEVTK